MRWSEAIIARAISTQTLNRRCVLLVDNCNWTGHECDVLGVTTDLRIIDVEIKISRADLKADAGKDKWWHAAGYGRLVDGRWQPPERVRVDWPRRVWKHYYAIPETIWTPALLDSLPSPASGVILMKSVRQFKDSPGIAVADVVRRARPNADAYRLQPSEVMDIARLASLRLWEAYVRFDTLREEAHATPG